MDTIVDAYERFAQMGAVLDIARLPILPGRNHEVAIRGMRVFAKRREDERAALNPGEDVSGYFRLVIDPDVDSGKRTIDGEEISFREFLGPGYDVHADRVCLFAYSPGSRSSSVCEGLAHALLNPPYGLQHPESFGYLGSTDYADREKAWMREILRAFCAEVLAIDDLQRVSHLRIHRWQTDWSNYFQAGLEWWGGFFWTVEDAKNGWVTVIGASTTD